MRLTFGTFAALGVALGLPISPVSAQAIGMQIVDSSGAPVGTVTAIQGANIQIRTDKHDALLPKASFTADNGKLLFGLSQAQLDSKIEDAAAASQKAIAAGATVNGSAGSPVGKIDAVEGANVTITLASGKKIQVPSTGLRGNADGTVSIGYTGAQLDALVAGGSPAKAGI